MLDILISEKFRKLIEDTTNNYSNILDEVSPFLLPHVPYGDIAYKICKSLAKLKNQPITKFLSESGDTDVRTAIDIITHDLKANRLEYELVQALTLLKRGRNAFLSVAEKEHKKWSIFIDSDTLTVSYSKAFLATILIAFCYKLLKDENMTSKYYVDAKFYFYHRIYSSFSCTNRMPRQDSIYINQYLKQTSEDGALALYKGNRKEEKEFIRMSKIVFDKQLTPSLPDKCATRYERGSYNAPGYGTDIMFSWKPPV
jgi:hypothetical protein